MELWREWQPLKFSAIQASGGAMRSVKHVRRKVQLYILGAAE